jgi:uncharacterized membrane protein
VGLLSSLILSGSGVAVAVVAFYNRDKPGWQRDMPRILFLAVMQVVLGIVIWILVGR